MSQQPSSSWWSAPLRAMRPRQWVKNVLVLAAPVAAGRLLEPEIAAPTALAFLSFCLASSAVYLVNDLMDREVDRLHPSKRDRPIASGTLSATTAWVMAGGLTAMSLVLGMLASWPLVALLISYLAMQLAYSLRLKHEPVLDLAVVATGFLLRGVAGGVAADIPLSPSFLLVSGFGSLFIVAGKRYSELHALGRDGATRRSLVRYSESYLRFVWSMAGAAVVMAYSLWAFEQSGEGTSGPWHAISIAAFVLAILRYAVDIDAGKAAEPEEIVWGDRILQAIGFVWLALVCLGILGA